jgi:hypothetical protein
MPQMTSRNGPALGIYLENDPIKYVPGNTISGFIFRCLDTVSPDASVPISLHGRSKSKMVINKGRHSRTYRSQFNLAHTKSQIIYQGPLHIPSGSGKRWQFAATIPVHTDPGLLTQSPQAEQKLGSYLPLDIQHVATH